MMSKEIKSKLIKIASEILTVVLSEVVEDYPKTTPKIIFKEIEWQSYKLRDIAVEIRKIANKL